MLSDIPTHLISGPLGAGKTSLIRALLAQKPAGERWAVLVNEFGQIGLDAALLTTNDAAISLAEVAGGCLCCVNGVPFQIGLGRLLRKAKPDRLFIEPSGLGHPAELLAQLAKAPWLGVLALQSGITVIDGPALARGETLPSSQAQALAEAGLIVINKSAQLDETERAVVLKRLPARPVCWAEQGQLPITAVPGIEHQARPAVAVPPMPAAANTPGSVWLDTRQPICQSQGNAEGWSIGWRWHPGQQFDLKLLVTWLDGLGWQRAKLVMQGSEGWYSANASRGEPLALAVTEWRKDSRLELIFPGPQDVPTLNAAVSRYQR